MVTVAAAVAQDAPIYLEQIGRMVAVESVAIVPQVGGKIISVHFRDGAFVKKGDLLFQIDPRPFEATLAAARAALAESRAALDLAKLELQRYKDAVAASAVSQMEYDQKRNAVAVTEAKVAASEAAVAKAELDLEWSRILSPIDGRAGARLVDPGNIVRPNDSPLLVVQRLDPIYAEFTVTENDLAAVRRYMALAERDRAGPNGSRLRVEVSVPGEGVGKATAVGASQPAGPSPGDGAAAFRGELTFLDNAVRSDTGTIKLRATLPNGDHHLWPGQFVNVRLVLGTLKDAVLIPAEAQQIGQQGPFVYVVGLGDIAELRPIVPGQRQGSLLVVQQGVQSGERVIVTGHMAVMPGGKVMIMEGGMPGGAATMPVPK